MTPDERIDRGLAAQILIEDENVKAFFKAREIECFERAAASTETQVHADAMTEVRILRALRQNLVAMASNAKSQLKKKEKTNA